MEQILGLNRNRGAENENLDNLKIENFLQNDKIMGKDRRSAVESDEKTKVIKPNYIDQLNNYKKEVPKISNKVIIDNKAEIENAKPKMTDQDEHIPNTMDDRNLIIYYSKQ